jgi:hypothetical protein
MSVPGKDIHPLAEERGGDEPEGVHDGEGVPHLLLSLYAGLCTGVESQKARMLTLED